MAKVLFVLTGAGRQIVVATPGGVVPHVDVMSLRPPMAGSEEIALSCGSPTQSSTATSSPARTPRPLDRRHRSS
jgi:hypothetical protein